MRKLRIGRLYIKPLYIILLAMSLLLVSGGMIGLRNPAVWYEYGYTFKNTDIQGLKHIDFSTVLAKGDIVRGKLVVESGMGVLVITDKNERRVVDSGEIQAGKTFSFSVMSDWTYTSYDASFFFTGDTNARFYCNLGPIISGSRLEETGEIIDPTDPIEVLGLKIVGLLERPEMREIIVIFQPTKLR